MATDTSPGVVARTGSRPLPWYAFGVANLVAVSVLSLLSWYLLVDPEISPLSVYPGPYQVVLFWAILSVVFVGFNLWDHWPYRDLGLRQPAGSRGAVAAASLVGNVVLGTVLYFVLGAVVKAVVGSSVVDELGPAINQFPAQIGVCWGFWMILWANAVANKPDGPSHAANLATRIAVTFVLGLATFVLYYYVLAGSVLHEPAVAGSLHGDALGWMDWMVLWILFYVVCLGSYGLPPQPEPAADADELPTA